MPVETATYIADLDATYPAADEDVEKGDDHLRLIKSVLKSSFTGITGAVTATHTELNRVVGLTSQAEERGRRGVADGYCDLDSSNLVPVARISAVFARLDVAQVFTEIPAFNGGTSGVSAPFSVDSTYLVTNLNAELLGGQAGSYYTNADNMASGTLPSGRLSGTYAISISGTAADADTVGTVAVTSLIRSDADDDVSANTEWQDNYETRWGTNADARMRHTGTHLELALVTGNFYIYDATFTTSRFLFKDNGDFHADGGVYAASTSVGSDRKFKKNFSVLDGALEKVKKLKAYEYTRISTGKREPGLIAQEVEIVLPSAVEKRNYLSKGQEFLSLNYNGVVALLVQAVKELEAEVRSLRGA
jgi:hypothetical protein